MQLVVFPFDTKKCISPEVACAMKKYISVLLAVFVFVLGIVTPVNVEANTDSNNYMSNYIDNYMNNLTKQLEEPIKKAILESLLTDVWVEPKTIHDWFKVDGVNNLKGVMVKDADGEDSLDKIVGEVAKGQKIRAHFTYKVPSDDFSA